MLGLALVHVNRSCRLSICMAEGNTKCISCLTFFLSSKINADQMKITNDFPLHHDWLSQFSKTVTISQMPPKAIRHANSHRRGGALIETVAWFPFLQRRAIERPAYTTREQLASRADKAVRAQFMRGRMAMLGLYVRQ
jgi:hypothetical protein